MTAADGSLETAAQLVRYEAAKKALAEAHRVDEVKDIRDQAIAMQVYARQARDRDLIEHAAEIRMRAERRLGEMMQSQREAVGTAQGQRTDLGFRETHVPTLAEAGIDKNLAHRARAAAALTDEQFAEKINDAKRTALKAIERGLAARAVPTPAPTADPFAEFEALDKDLDIDIAKWLKMAPRIIDAIALQHTSAAAYSNAIRRLVAIFGKAAGIELSMHEAKNEEAEHRALIIQWRAVVKTGMLLANMEEAGFRHSGKAKKGTQPGAPTDQLMLEDLGIHKIRSQRWQFVSRLPEAEIQDRIAKNMRPRPYPEDVQSAPQSEHETDTDDEMPLPESESLKASPPTQPAEDPATDVALAQPQQQAECSAITEVEETAA